MLASELRALLKKAKRRPMSCVVALTKDKQGVILLDRRKKPRKLMGELRGQAKAAGLELDATTIRFGRASVDGASDSAQVNITVNKPVPGAMRLALLPQLRAAGMQRCTINVDEAIEAEADDGEDEPDDGDEAGDEDRGGAPGSARGGTVPAPGSGAAPAGLATSGASGAAGPSGAPSSPGAALRGGQPPFAGLGEAPGAEALRVRLTPLVRCVAGAAGSGQPNAKALQAAAQAAYGALKSGDLAATVQGTDALERLLRGGTVGAPSPTSAISPTGTLPAAAGAALPGATVPGTRAPGDGGTSQGGTASAGTLKGELTGLAQRIAPAIATDPSRKAALLDLAGKANARLKSGDAGGAAAGIAALREALHAPAVPDGGPADGTGLPAGGLELSQPWAGGPQPGLQATQDPLLIQAGMGHLPDAGTAGNVQAVSAVFSRPGATPTEPAEGDPLLTLVQRGPSRPPRGIGPGGREPSLPEVMRTARFGNAARELRQLEPNNRQLSYVAPPGWVPSEANVGDIEFELGAARGRATGRPNFDPLAPGPGSSPPGGSQEPTAAQPIIPQSPTLMSLEPKPGFDSQQPASPIIGLSALPPQVSGQDIAAFRARIGVPSRKTVGVGRTNVPGLENEIFEGASPKVRVEGGMPVMESGPIASPRTEAIFRNHAEQDIANQFIAAAERAGLQAEIMEGRELLMRIQNEGGICTVCRQGLRNPNVPPGVLKQLSERYPKLSIHVVVDNPGPELAGPADFVIRNGTYVE